MTGFITDSALFQNGKGDSEYPIRAFVARDTLYFILELEGDISKEQVDQICDNITECVTSKKPQTLSAFRN